MNVLVQKGIDLASFIIRSVGVDPINFVEIGVYDGKNACIIANELKRARKRAHYVGFDLFESAKEYTGLINENPGITKHIKSNKSFINKMSRTSFFVP